MNIKNDGLPSNLEEAIETVLGFFSDIVKSIEENDEETFVTVTHHAGGQFLRNSWFLWWTEGHGYSEWPKEKPELITYFNDMNIYHADDISSIILLSAYRTHKGIDIKLEEQVKHYIDFWKKSGFPDGIPK